MLNFLFTKTPLLFLTQSFWRDEAFSYFMAKKSIIEIIFLTAKDFNPPLYYFILHFWMKVFGGSEIALRSLSIVFFWGTIYVAFLFLNDVFKMKQKKAFCYLILFIINPLLLYYAFEARMYSMLAFFTILSFYYFFKKNYKLYTLVTVFGLFTHYFMIFVVAGQWLFLWINKKKGFQFKKSSLYLLGLIFSPWLLFSLLQKNLFDSFWITRPQIKYILGLPVIVYTGIESFINIDPIMLKKIQNNLFFLTLVLLLVLITGVYFYFRKLDKKDQLIFQMLFIWAVSFVKPIFLARYLIFASAGLILLVIFILEKINGLTRAFLLVLLFALTINYNQLQLSYGKKIDSEKTLREIKAIMNKGDSVYVESDLDYFTAEYYVNDSQVFIYGKDYRDIPTYVGKALIPKEKIAYSLPFYPQKAFILNSNGQYTIQAMY
ncbi:MAG TPA: glycosyltransferase family 39 protein [Patescibacteria group bacterium]